MHAFVKKNTGYIVTNLQEVTGFLHSLNFERPKLSYQDFLMLVLPQKGLKTQQRILQRALLGKGEEPQKVNFAICQILDQELRLYRELDYLRDIARESERGLHLMRAFQIIDTKKTGGLTATAIQKFLNQNIPNTQFTTKEVKSVFRRLRLPQRAISYVDLLNALFRCEHSPVNTQVEEAKIAIVHKLSNKQS